MRKLSDTTQAEWDALRRKNNVKYHDDYVNEHPVFGDEATKASTYQHAGPMMTYNDKPVTAKSSNPKLAAGNKKVPLHLVPLSAMAYTAQGLGEGAKKYGQFNYRDTDVETQVYVGAALRHIMAYADGEDTDPDSGNPHLAHAMASLAILIDTIESGRAIDTRPTAGAGPATLKRLSDDV